MNPVVRMLSRYVQIGHSKTRRLECCAICCKQFTVKQHRYKSDIQLISVRPNDVTLVEATRTVPSRLLWLPKQSSVDRLFAGHSRIHNNTCANQVKLNLFAKFLVLVLYRFAETSAALLLSYKPDAQPVHYFPL